MGIKAYIIDYMIHCEKKPNIIIIPTEHKPEYLGAAVSPFVRDLIGDRPVSKENVSLIAIEPEHDPTYTGPDKLVIYFPSDTGVNGPPDAFCLPFHGLPTNGTYAAMPMNKILTELEDNGANMYAIASVEDLGSRELGKGGFTRNDPRTTLMHEFEHRTGFPWRLAFIIEGITTVAEVRAGTMNFEPLPVSGPEKFRDGWRLVGLMNHQERAASGVVQPTMRKIQMYGNAA